MQPLFRRGRRSVAGRRLIRRVITYRLLSLLLALIAGCAADMQTCTPVFGTIVPTTGYGTGGQGAQCPLGQVLVGYDPGVTGGPLLCAPFTVSCPIPTK
jgi:hypothetical protein